MTRLLVATVLVVALLAVPTAAASTSTSIGAAGELTQPGDVPADAQDANETDGNATETDTDDAANVVAQVDDRLRVTDYRYNATRSQFWVRVQNTGDVGSTVTITESLGRDGESTRTFGIARVTIEPGEKLWVSVSAQRVRGKAAVTVVTDISLQRKTGVYLEEDRDDGRGLLDGQASGAEVRMAGFSASVVALIGVVLGAWRYLAKSTDDVQDVDLGGDR